MAATSREDARLRPSEAAAVLGVSTVTVAAFAKTGRLRYEATPLGRLFQREDVEQLRRERERRRTGAIEGAVASP